MADQQPPPEESPGGQTLDDAAQTGTPAPGPQGDSSPPGKGSGRAPWLALLALIGVVVVLQVAGLLLRDRLEQRLPPLAEAPAMVGEAEGDTVPAAAAGTRFGPEVREVAVAAAETHPMPAPDAPTGAPETQQPPPAVPPAAADLTTAPGNASAPTPQPTPAAAPPPPPAAQAPAATPAAVPVPTAGSHALQVGVFGSQKYRRDMERKLEKAGLPHFRRQRSKQGEGYRLALTLADAGQRGKAAAALDGLGVLYTLQEGSLEALFHFEAEAQLALGKLSDAGLNGGYAKTRGELPQWVVYAGPFALEEAKRVRQQLAILGLPSYLRNAP